MTDVTAIEPGMVRQGPTNVAAPPETARGVRLPTQWLGVAPFFIFALMFLILPTAYLMLGAFQNDDGAFTLDNIVALAEPSIVAAYWISIKVSVASAILGAFIGLAIAIAIVRGGLPDWIRSATLTYLYFQIPLMVVIIVPAIDGLKKEWGEAAATLGATQMQYWRMVVIPVLWPSFLGTVILLFANAFGAIATAYALTGSSLNIVPILLYAQIRGDVLHNAHLGYAIAFGMILITGLANVGYIVFRTRSERWLK